MKNTNPNHPIDARFRKALEGHATPGGQALWAKLEGQLPPEKKRRPFGLWVFAALLLGASLTTLIFWPTSEEIMPTTQSVAEVAKPQPQPLPQENANEAVNKAPKTATAELTESLASQKTTLKKPVNAQQAKKVKLNTKPQAARLIVAAKQAEPLPQMLNTAPLVDLHPQTLSLPVVAGKLQKLPDSLKPKAEITVHIHPGQPAAREATEGQQSTPSQKFLEDAKRIGKAAKKLKFGEIFNKK